MSFKKLHPHLKETLSHLGYEDPLPFQKQLLPKIKSGSSVFAIGPKGSGKTTTMIISTLQKLQCQAFEDSPRALIFVENKQAALELENSFQAYTKHTGLRVYSAYEEQRIDHQKEDIYFGQDIVIATPRRLHQLFLISGINLSQLQLFIIEDAQFLSRYKFYSDLVRIPESINKCQYLVFANTLEQKLSRFQDSFMANAPVIESF